MTVFHMSKDVQAFVEDKAHLLIDLEYKYHFEENKNLDEITKDYKK